LNHLSQLIAQIEQLSPDNQAKLADYVAFLRWQEEQAEAPDSALWSFSFIEAFKEATVYASQDPAGMDVKLAPASVGGQSRPALWGHPPLAGQAVIEYHVPIPETVQNVRLHLAIGIRDGAKIAEDNLVAFSVKLNGLRVWGQQSNAQQWQNAAIPLNLPAGDLARIAFCTEALGSHQWTWAVWGEPELKGVMLS
jgi:hypothetical protein